MRCVEVGVEEISHHGEKVARSKCVRSTSSPIPSLSNERKWVRKSAFERNYNSLIRTAHCPLQKMSYANHDP